MTDLPEVKLKALVNFPASAEGRTGIDVTKDGGTFYLDLDYADFQITPTVPAEDMPNSYNLIWDEVKGTFAKVPFALQATSGVSSLDGHTGALEIGDGLEFTGDTLDVIPFRFASQADVLTTTIPSSVDAYFAEGYASPGDGGKSFNKRTVGPAGPGKRQSADGAWWVIDEPEPNERMFGAANVSGATDTAAIQSLLDYCGIYFSRPACIVGKGYNITSTLYAPNKVCIQANAGPVVFGGGEFHFTKSTTSDMLDLGLSCQVHNLTAYGNPTSYPGGRGIVIDSSHGAGGDQRIVNCQLLDFAEECIEYVGSGAGIRSVILGGYYLRSDSKLCAIQWASETSNGNRIMLGVRVIGHLDTGDCDNGTVLGCELSNIVFGASSKKVKVNANRITNGALSVLQTCTIQGVTNTLTANTFSGDVAIGACTGTIYDDTNIHTSLTYATPHASNVIYFKGTYTPAWSCATTPPALGNGSLTGSYVLAGRMCTVNVKLIIGSTSTMGTGKWKFSLPIAPVVPAEGIKGPATAFDAGTSHLSATSMILSGETDITSLVGAAPANYTEFNVPITWATGDRLEMTITYPIH